jgi:hypothetical protein
MLLHWLDTIATPQLTDTPMIPTPPTPTDSTRNWPISNDNLDSQLAMDGGIAEEILSIALAN